MRDVASCIERDKGVSTPKTCHDKLGVTMRFLRAIERHHWEYARRLSSAYPKLAELVNLNASNLHIDPGLQLVREHAGELSRISLLDEIEAFNREQSGMSDSQAMARRQSIMARLLRLKPGAAIGIQAVIG